jgi:hypothetical protein
MSHAEIVNSCYEPPEVLHLLETEYFSEHHIPEEPNQDLRILRKLNKPPKRRKYQDMQIEKSREGTAFQLNGQRYIILRNEGWIAYNPGTDTEFYLGRGVDGLKKGLTKLLRKIVKFKSKAEQ